MKTIEITLYKFDELSVEIQQEVLENLYDINLDYDWWDMVYEDANTVDLKIADFDLDRGSYVNLSFVYTAEDTANEILKQHGESTETYKLAKNFLAEFKDAQEREERFSELYENAEQDSEEEENYRRDREQAEDDMEELSDQFLEDLSKEYLEMLRSEYEYRISEEAIKEAIRCNEYDFTENGKLY